MFKLICLGFKCDRVVVISLEDKVKVCGVLISVGDYGMWDGSLENIEDNKVMEVIGVERIKMSVVLEILKKSDVRYEKLGYSRMRVSLLYGKKFRFEKGEDGMVEVVKVGV